MYFTVDKHVITETDTMVDLRICCRTSLLSTSAPISIILCGYLKSSSRISAGRMGIDPPAGQNSAFFSYELELSG